MRALNFYPDRIAMALSMRWCRVRAQRSVGSGVRAGRLLSIEIGNIGVPTCCGSAEGSIGGGVMREPSADPAGSENPCMCVISSC